MPLLVGGIALAGAAWGVFTTVMFATAVALSGGRGTLNGVGTATGLLFSALASGALLRLAWVAAGLGRAALVAWLPVVAWALAALLLLVFVRQLWQSRDDVAA